MLPYIDENMVKKVIDEKVAFRLAMETFKLIADKKTLMPPKIYLSLPRRGVPDDFRAMPAFVGGRNGGICGVKWVSVFPKNYGLGLPTVYATILLNSAATGAPLAILEGNHITAIRTGAAAAVATSFMANPKPRKLAIIGAGTQGEYQLRALTSLFSFEEIGVWGFLSKEAVNFCKRLGPRFPQLKPYKKIKDCVFDADVIVTCTPSSKPLVKKEWVKRGAHINAIGADAKGKEELNPRILKNALIVVDEWEQASHSGEINVPFAKGLFLRRDLYAELSEIVLGKKKGRRQVDDITIFDSTGLAVLDIYFANYAHEVYRLGV